MTVTEHDLERESGERQPPSDIGAEQQVLGSMMMSTDAIADVSAVIKGRDFYRPAHEQIYDAAMGLYEAGKAVDPLTVADELQRRGELSRVGGRPYLAQVFHLLTTAANAGYHAQIVAEQAARRRVIDAGTMVQQLGYAGAESPHQLVDRATAELQQAVGVVHTYEPPLETYQQLVDSLDGNGPIAAAGWSWGFYDVDEKMNPIRPGQLTVIAARPGIGKSVLVNNVCTNVSLQSKPQDDGTTLHGRSLIIGMEMTAAEVWQRLVSAHASVLYRKLTNPEHEPMDDREWQLMATTGRELFEADRLHVEYAPNCTVADARAMIRYHRPHVVGIDYLQIMGMARGENRQQEVAATTRALKVLAQTEGVGILLLSQLNRGPEHRADKLPQLSDLRESGAIEQDADGVVFIHRPDAYEREGPRMGEADLFCAKQRGGQSGWTAQVAFQGHFQRFVDMVQL